MSVSSSTRIIALALCGVALLMSSVRGQGSPPESGATAWTRLPNLPHDRSLVGFFCGASGNALIVAGGVELAAGDSRVSESDARWHDEIWALVERENNAYQWHPAGRLPRPLAFGAAASTGQDLVCVGGTDGNQTSSDVLLLSWNEVERKVTARPLPPLPTPLAEAGCTADVHTDLNAVIYAVGGQREFGANEASASTFALALDVAGQSDSLGWRTLPDVPGGGRIAPVTVVQNDGFDSRLFVVGGYRPGPGASGGVGSEPFKDVYSLAPDKSWKKLSDSPYGACGAAGMALGQSHILLFARSDSDLLRTPADIYRGKSAPALTYNAITDAWSERPELVLPGPPGFAGLWEGSVAAVGTGGQSPTGTLPALKADYQAPSAQFGLLNYAVLIAYFVALVSMGVYFSKREASTKDFFLGGYRVPWWAAGISIFGTQLSAITVMALPAKVYATNCHYLLRNVLGVCILAPIGALLLIPRLRQLNVTSAYEYLEHRFNLTLRLIASAAFILSQVSRMAVVIFLPSIVLSHMTGISIPFSICTMGILCTFYTAMGGIEAVIWSDVLQVFILLGAAVLCFFCVAGNLDGGAAQIMSDGLADGKFNVGHWGMDLATTSLLVVILGGFSAAMPYVSDQTVIQRYLTTQDEKKAAKAVLTNAVMSLPGGLLFFVMGVALFVFYKANPGLVHPAIDNDWIFPWFVMQQLPAGVSGLIVAGVFAAAMSSLDSSMNSSAAAILTDFVCRFKSGISERRNLMLARILTVAFGALGTGTALLMSRYDIKSLQDTLSAFVGLFIGGLGGLFLLGVLSRRAHGRGALVGLIASAAALYYVTNHTDLHFFLYGEVGLFSCMIVGYLASLIIPDAPDSKGRLKTISEFEQE